MVAVDVLGDLFEGSPAVVGDDLGHAAGEGEHLAQLDLHVRGRAAGAGGALVDHDAGVGEGEALPAAPPERIMAAADMPMPTQMVDTSGSTCCMTS